MAKNRIFFPQDALDTWVVDERIELTESELTVKPEGRKYRLAEAAYVVAEVTGAPDPHEIVGRVKSKGFLVELGAEMLEKSMMLGDNAYDIEPGFLGAPSQSFAKHRASFGEASASHAETEEALLAALLVAADAGDGS